MHTVSSFAEVNSLIYELLPSSTSMKEAFSLDGMYSLMTLLGNPQNELKIVHIAGTSGKTSTCYYTAALLQAAGNKVGLTVSPHIDEINERVQLGLVPLDEVTFCNYFNEFINIDGLVALQPSYFEVIVAFAFWVFAREKVDYAVIEVGVGGIGDATNVISRADKVCVITDIGLDHMRILGSTIEKITVQKAGIVQSHNNVVTIKQDEAVLQLIEQTAKQKQAKLRVVHPEKLTYLADLPPFKQRNWQLAQAVYDVIANRDGLVGLSEEQLAKTAHVTVPARMEIVELDGKTIVLDGSHNAQKLSALRTGMEARFGDEPVALLTSFLQSRGNRIEDALSEIIPFASSVIVTTYETGQDYLHHSMPLAEMTEACKQAGAKSVEAVEDPKQAFTALLSRPEKVLLVTGSFYLLNHIRPIIKERLQSD